MAPSIASLATNSSTSSSTLTIAIPSGTAIGDLLVLLAAGMAIGGNGFDTAPSGWTQIAFAQSNNTDSNLGAYWRVADGSEGADVTVSQSTATQVAGAVYRIVGFNEAAPIDAVGTLTQPTIINTLHSLFGVVTTVPDCLTLRCASASYYPAGGLNWDTGDGGGTSQTPVVSSSGGSGVGLCVRTLPKATASSTGTLNLSDPSATGFGCSGFSFSIAPVPQPVVLAPQLRASHLQHVNPNQFRGRAWRSPLNAPDYVPPPVLVPANRKALQRPVPGDVLEGRALRPTWVPLAQPYYPPNPPPSRRAFQPPVPGRVLQGLGRRSRIPPFVEYLRRELALRFKVDVLAPQLFRVVARNTATNVETVLGTCTAAAPTIGSVALADGDYVLRVEVDGEYWRRARVLQEWPVRIAGGAVALPMPPVSNLQVVWQDGVPVLHWNWNAAAGYGVPASFVVRSGVSNPPTTPAGSVVAVAPAGYQLTIAAPGSPTYYGVAAFDGTSVYGPLSVVLVSPVVTLDHPRPQSMRRGDGDWLTN